MKIYINRGNRIRASDKSLVFNFAVATLIAIFSMMLLLLNVKQVLNINLKNVSVLKRETLQFNITTHFVFSMIFAVVVSLLSAWLYYHFQYDRIKQLIHRQKLARMILENKWYEAEQVQSNSFFNDLPSGKAKEKITHFPKMYYKLEKGLIHIQVEITLGKYQDQLLHLEKKLESGLYCELTDKELKDSYVEYTLLYDTIANRISIEDVQAEHGKLRLMKNIYWEYDKLPHMLIAGGTGGGKSYFILTLIEALLGTNSILYVLDPKNADLADLEAVMPNVYYKRDDMIACIDNFYDGMMKRNEDMKQMKGYKTGENYAYLGLPANFLIFDVRP